MGNGVASGRMRCLFHYPEIIGKYYHAVHEGSGAGRDERAGAETAYEAISDSVTSYPATASPD